MSPAAVLGAALLGLGSGLALIVAIGAQNAFVLRQGLHRQFVGTVAALMLGLGLQLALGA